MLNSSQICLRVELDLAIVTNTVNKHVVCFFFFFLSVESGMSKED